MTNECHSEPEPKKNEASSDPKLRERVERLAEKVSRLDETLGEVDETLAKEP